MVKLGSKIYFGALSKGYLDNMRTGWRKVSSWSAALRKDGKCFSILPLSAATLFIFLVRLWATSNWPVIEGTCKAIRFKHRFAGLTCPFEGGGKWRVHRLLRGFRKRSKKPGKQKRRPITTIILHMIASLGVLDLTCHNDRCMWAAMCVAVYCLLRSGEFLEFSDNKKLLYSDFAWLNQGRTSAKLSLRNTKTSVWDEELEAYFFWNGSQSCPALAMQTYLDRSVVEIKDDSPLFILSNGAPLRREQLIPWMRKLLSLLKLPAHEFNGISFRKGGATMLRMLGVSSDIIRLMGRWADASMVHERYEAISNITIRDVTQKMSKWTAEFAVEQGQGAVLFGEFDSTGIFDEVEASRAWIETAAVLKQD
jgi:hypothetical protein